MDLIQDIIVIEGRIMKNKKLIGIIILALIVLFIIVWYIQPKTPLAALEKEYMGKEESILHYSSLIEQIDISADESLLFYFNGNGNLNCAVAEKRFNRYKIVDVNAELATHREGLRAGLYGSTYNNGNRWMYFGVIYDDTVEKVVWNNIEALRFKSQNIDMFYANGIGEFEGQEYYLYDSEGNELDHHDRVQ